MFKTLLNETATKQAKQCLSDLKSVSDPLKTQMQEMKKSIDSLGNQTRSDFKLHQDKLN